MKTYENEIWKPVTIKEFSEVYSVSNYGRIKSKGFSYLNWDGRMFTKAPRIIKERVQQGYNKLSITFNKKKYYFQSHQLIAKAFIPNPENKPFVNHKDGNGLNNHIDNLEWCTQNENMAHSYYVLKKRGYQNRPIIQMSMDGTIVNRYSGVNEAGKVFGKTSNSGIWAAVNGKTKTAYGYKWKYE